MGRKNPWTITVAPNQRTTLKAATAISMGRAFNYAGQQISVLGAPAYGIAMQDAAIGEDFAGVVGDEAVAQVGAAVAVGAELTASASGKLVTAAAGQFVIARALEAAAADGEYIRVNVSREGNKA